MKTPLARTIAPTLILAATLAWSASSAAADDQGGGLPGLAASVSRLSNDVLALLGRAPDCPCYEAGALRALEPVICQHETLTFVDKTVGSLLSAGPFDQDPLYTARAELTLGGYLGFCSNPLGFHAISYEQAKACGRLMEETIGPCAEVQTSR